MTLGARMAELARMTLQDPQRAARALLAEGVPLRARSAGLLLVAVLSALLASLHVGNPESLDPFSALMLGSPIQAAVFQWLFLAATVFRHLDIDLGTHWVNPQGRPIPIVVEGGRPIPELV